MLLIVHLGAFSLTVEDQLQTKTHEVCAHRHRDARDFAINQCHLAIFFFHKQREKSAA